MADLGADKKQSTLLVLFIPSSDRNGKSLGGRVQTSWVRKSLTLLGEQLGGATAFPRGLGVWRDDARGGRLVWDKPVMIQCYSTEEMLERYRKSLREFLTRMGAATRQGSVGFVIDRVFFEIYMSPKEGRNGQES